MIWSACNDHSPKVRLIASNALSVLLECVRAFLFHLASSEDHHQSVINPTSSAITNSNQQPFLTISAKISQLIKHLHRVLISSLMYRETFNLNLINLIKCLQSLVRATPYEKLRPGLIYKLLTSLNTLLSQKSAQLVTKANSKYNSGSGSNQQPVLKFKYLFFLVITFIETSWSCQKRHIKKQKEVFFEKKSLINHFF